eukprot:g3423.t1
MKFGKILALNIFKEWSLYYIQYKKLKRFIKRCEFKMGRARTVSSSRSALPKKIFGKAHVDRDADTEGELESLLVVRHSRLSSEEDESTDAVKYPSASQSFDYPSKTKDIEQFFAALDENARVIEAFFVGKLADLKLRLQAIEAEFKRGRAYNENLPLNSDDIADFILQLKALETYQRLNTTGFRKIVKKFDKTMGTRRLAGYMERLKRTNNFAKEIFYRSMSKRVERLTSRENLLSIKLRASRDLQRRQLDAVHGSTSPRNTRATTISLVVCTAAMLFAMTRRSVLIDVHPTDAQLNMRANRCFVMLLYVLVLWVFELLPFFATALVVPTLVVMFGIVGDGTVDNGDCASLVMSSLFSRSSVIILAGFAISAAFSKSEVERRVASKLQELLGTRPKLFILAIMYLGLFLSLIISNRTAPVLCVSTVLPIIRDFDVRSSYVKSLLLGISFACNFGGMVAPISSVQNILAFQALARIDSGAVTFGSLYEVRNDDRLDERESDKICSGRMWGRRG